MKESKHSPGPWKARAWGNTLSIDTAKQGGIAFVNPLGNRNGGIPSRQDRDNAQLIAAAPELLEACTMALPRLSVMEAGDAKLTVKIIKAAIAKAEGGN